MYKFSISEIMRYIITGGCGFIGINVINKLIKNKNNKILNIDKLTYSANKKLIGSLLLNLIINF